MEPIEFKFRFVNASGNETGFRASRGVLGAEKLVLGETVLPLASIYQVVRRYGRLAIVYSSANGSATLTITAAWAASSRQPSIGFVPIAGPRSDTPS